MWYPATVAAPGTEPVTSAQAKFQCRIASSDTSFDTEITRLITVARNYVEKRCGVRFAQRTAVALKCDCFDDFEKLPEAPLSAVVITYVDEYGATQTLDAAVYELRGDDLDVAIVLKYGQAWPSIRPGSRITATATIGYSAAPESVVQAMLIHIADDFANKENAALENWTALDALLINHTRNA